MQHLPTQSQMQKQMLSQYKIIDVKQRDDALKQFSGLCKRMVACMTNSKYRVILDDLEKKLENGTLSCGDMLPTENEFMETYEVSRTTVQRALNILVSRGSIYRVPGKGTFVSQPSIVGANPSGDSFSGGNFAIVLPYHSPIIIKYLAGAQTYFNQHHANLTIRFSDYTYQGENELITSLLNENIDGIILYPCGSSDPRHLYSRYAQEQTPIVLIDKQISGAPLCSVTSDNYQGGRLAAEQFIRNGHRNFACFSQSFLAGNSLLDRFRGFTDTLRQSKMELRRENILILPTDDKEHPNYFLKFFQSIDKKHPLAIFCTTDTVAAGTYRSASDFGFKIPDDLSVIGYDDLEIARLVNPPLTTIEQPYAKIGEAAAKLLMQQVNQPNCSCINLQMPVSVIERASVSNRQR